MDSNPICHPSPANKMKCSFLDYIQLLMIGQAGQWTWTQSATPLQPKMKCSFLDYVQLLMIGQAGWWTQTPSATPLQPKKWNAHFWITFNCWWLARLVGGLEPHLPPLSSKKWNAHFWIMFNFWWSAGLVDGFKPHPPPLSSQNNEMLIFGLRSTYDDQPGWSMDSNPICHLSPAKKMKCSFLDYVQLLMISQVIPATNGDWNAKKGPLSYQKMKCSFSDGLPEDHQKTIRRPLAFF